MKSPYDVSFNLGASSKRDKFANQEEQNLPEALSSFYCGVCNRPVSNGELRFRCAVCHSFGLCSSCFAKGRETAKHKNSHPYRVVCNVASLSLNEATWGLDEELLLLEGIELYGLGNWSGVGTHVATKNAKECESHYMATYIHGLGKVPVNVKSKEQLRREKQWERKLRKVREELKTIPGADIVGYMPLRQDFDIEFQNEAEKMISNLSFSRNAFSTSTSSTSVSNESRKVKLELIHKYNGVVEERIRRKRFVKEYELLKWREWRRKMRRAPKDEIDARKMLIPLARYIRKQDFEELVYGILQEHRLENEIEFLKKCEAMGMNTLHEVENYRESLKRKATGIVETMRLQRRKRKGRESTSSEVAIRKSKRRSAYRGTYEESNDDLDFLEDHELDIEANQTKYSQMQADSKLVYNNLREYPQMSETATPTKASRQYSQLKGSESTSHTALSTKDIVGVTESSLCSLLGIEKWQYLKVKSLLIEECIRQKIFIRKKDGTIKPADRDNQIVLVDISKHDANLDFHVRVMTPQAAMLCLKAPSAEML